MIARVNDESFRASTRSDILEASCRLSPILISPSVSLELLGQWALHVLGQLRDCTVEAQTGLDADREQVERVGEIGADLLAAPLRLQRDEVIAAMNPPAPKAPMNKRPRPEPVTDMTRTPSAPRRRRGSPWQPETPVGERRRPRPAPSSRSEIASMLVRGLTFSTHLAKVSRVGSNALSRSRCWSSGEAIRMKPYVVARRIERARLRDGSVATSPARNTAPARQAAQR